jgi:hypothetical protein
MAIKESRTIKAILKVQEFLDSQEERAKNLDRRQHWLDDKSLLDEISHTILVSEEDGLNLLREKIVGFTHYFGTYSTDLERLRKLLNSLYEAMMLDFVDIRNRKR